MVDPITVNTDAGETLLRFRDDVVHDEPAVTLDAFLGQTNATAVRLEAGDDARELLPHLGQIALVEISFPTFRDGRGYSAARILREAGFEGELRAAGAAAGAAPPRKASSTNPASRGENTASPPATRTAASTTSAPDAVFVM